MLASLHYHITCLLVLREPERSAVWFRGRKGCFEMPKLGKDPQLINYPELEESVKTLNSIKLINKF